jgi:hypothetical protein
MLVRKAAEIVALDARVFARHAGTPVTFELVEARVSELRTTFPANTYKGCAARVLAGDGRRQRAAYRLATQDDL